MKTYTALLAMLALAALLISCPSVSDGSSSDKGLVRISFNETIPRTMLTDPIRLKDFKDFLLQFSPANSGDGSSKHEEFSYDMRNSIVVLEPGHYNLDIVAYLDMAKEKPAAAASVYGIEIKSGINKSIHVTLQGISIPTDGDEVGTYTWDIDVSEISGTVTYAKMTIRNMADNSEVTNEILATGIPGDEKWIGTMKEELTVGFYFVDFELEVNNNTSNKKQFRHILHIFQNLNTTITYKFTDELVDIISIAVRPTIDYEHPVDHDLPIVPSATTATGNGTKATPYVLTIGAIGNADRITLTATTTGFDITLSWFVDGVYKSSTNPFTIIAGTTAPFDVPLDVPYQVRAMATRTVDGVTLPYNSKEIFIQVIGP